MIGGIHLPASVGNPRALAGRGRPPTWRSGSLLRATEPALQRPLGGDGLLGMPLTQEHAEEARPPTGMFGPQGQGLLDQGWGFAQRRPTTARIARGKIVIGLGAPLVQQMTDRPGCQAQRLGDRGDILALLRA